jgi:hypothetical protein
VNDLSLSTNKLTIDGYWQRPINKTLFSPTIADLALFDQNGYDLTDLEQRYAHQNLTTAQAHRYHRALKYDWFTQVEKNCFAVLNHSLLFERKAYSGLAQQQLLYWAKTNPLVHKLLALRPKWGLDFSMDYVNQNGDVFEILHWEYDGFDYEQVQVYKLQLQAKFAAIDWDDAGEEILRHKDQWHHLDFFEQSHWKCDYFGIPHERFKMVAWQ